MEETGLHRKVWREFNRLLEYIDEITPRKGFGIRTSRTPNGTTVAVDIDEVTPPPAQPIQWKGEWSASETYQENDIVIRGSANPSTSSINDTNGLLSDGLKAGVYIALRDTDAGEEPTEPPTGDAWETLARFASPIITARQSGSTATSKISLDATSPNGSVSIQLALCNGKALTVREIPICVNGQEKRMMVIGSASYDPPP